MSHSGASVAGENRNVTAEHVCWGGGRVEVGAGGGGGVPGRWRQEQD